VVGEREDALAARGELAASEGTHQLSRYGGKIARNDPRRYIRTPLGKGARHDRLTLGYYCFSGYFSRIELHKNCVVHWQNNTIVPKSLTQFYQRMFED
jgi:hypothetical protein